MVALSKSSSCHERGAQRQAQAHKALSCTCLACANRALAPFRWSAAAARHAQNIESACCCAVRHPSQAQGERRALLLHVTRSHSFAGRQALPGHATLSALERRTRPVACWAKSNAAQPPAAPSPILQWASMAAFWPPALGEAAQRAWTQSPPRLGGEHVCSLDALPVPRCACGAPVVAVVKLLLARSGAHDTQVHAQLIGWWGQGSGRGSRRSAPHASFIAAPDPVRLEPRGVPQLVACLCLAARPPCLPTYHHHQWERGAPKPGPGRLARWFFGDWILARVDSGALTVPLRSCRAGAAEAQGSDPCTCRGTRRPSPSLGHMPVSPCACSRWLVKDSRLPSLRTSVPCW